MTSEDFQQLFLDIQAAIVDVIAEVVDTDATKIIGRDVFDESDKIWLGRLAAPDDSIHCWSVFYKGCANLDEKEVPAATEIFIPEFRIIGYYGYNFGTNADNSSDKFKNELNALRYAFMNNATLGLGSPVESHTGFTDETRLGTINEKRVHIAKVDMGVVLSPIPYDYN